MRRASVLRGVLVIVLVAMVALSRVASTSASTIAFRGGPEDHFWDVSATFCTDGFKISATELAHDGGAGDDKPYALVITTTAPLITTPMPAIIGRWTGGVTHPLESV